MKLKMYAKIYKKKKIEKIVPMKVVKFSRYIFFFKNIAL